MLKKYLLTYLVSFIGLFSLLLIFAFNSEVPNYIELEQSPIGFTLKNYWMESWLITAFGMSAALGLFVVLARISISTLMNLLKKVLA
jgi:hypothetical protein